jgi:hypothetical protein
MFRSGKTLPGLMSAEELAMTVSFTESLLGAKMYRFSPSA